jgi:broad specificity phosphatase PhoE
MEGLLVYLDHFIKSFLYSTCLPSAETDFNKNDIVQGITNSKLSPHGIQQAKLLGENFSDVYFDFVFTSSLERAYHVKKNLNSRFLNSSTNNLCFVQTATEIVNSNKNKSKLHVIKDKLLIERVIFYYFLIICSV